ncbi:thiamine ABC transporter ATP-binding protein [Aureimonas sp. Leaf324]|jgi:thiamine transport system ATP-binding protein|uniref:thiamine ABC transporter ATP-binding protein n=1 Tax=Aureimonas sp. Leaf324 TaxID=1736336 RepID=UPI000700F9C0|nr:thiamine ABC transporter ATP-binding protein [Aureimonas sp. Leaf324]KQQ88678.1 thiamine ABC transporter ATP-binding protein [Aureimonas sp. Leaf324]
MNAIELDAVTFAHETSEMRFDLEVAPGEWLAVIGPSGAGKSTLLDIVAGFLKPDSGTVRLEGRDMTGRSPAERPISMVFQDDNLFPHLTAERNVALGISPTWRIPQAALARAREALTRVGLGALAGRLPGELSGGERQRVALARAFLRERPILALDEPFAALGPALRTEMLALVDRLRADAPRPPAIIMVTHHPGDAIGHADRVAFLEAGRIVLSGTPNEILSGRHPRVAAYLGATRGVEP